MAEDLLTPEDWEEIYTALRDTTFTLFKEAQIVLRKHVDTLDRFGENPKQFTDVSLVGYIEPDTNSTDNKVSIDGTQIERDIVVSFDFSVLEGAGLTQDRLSIIDPVKDHFLIHGVRYNITANPDNIGLTPKGYILVSYTLSYKND
jgi:hypothetical protein